MARVLFRLIIFLRGRSDLEVKALDELGRWSAPRVVLHIVCAPAWHELGWVRVLAGVLGAVLLCGLGLWWRRREVQRKLLREQAENWLRYLSEKEAGGADEEPADDEDSALSELDRQFIDQARVVVRERMGDCTFSMEDFASAMCMSRANLYRKMKSLMGKSPSDFLRDQRLERAAELLREGRKSVGEISEAVGFTYTSYFAKCFKERFGVSPKEY